MRSDVMKHLIKSELKILEKVVATRLESHFSTHKLHDDLQSAYSEVHSTETALLKEHHDAAEGLE